MNETPTTDPDAGPSTPSGANADDEPPHETSVSAGEQGDAPAAAPVLSIDDQSHQQTQGLSGWLSVHLARGLDHVAETFGPLTFVIINDDAMAALHHQYHGLDTTTDVITFDLRDQPGDPVEGDIVVCIDEAQRQAKARGHTIREELLLYAVHGLMHLLGEDDHTDDDYRRMHTRENDLLQAMGFDRLFGDETPDRDAAQAAKGGKP